MCAGHGGRRFLRSFGCSIVCERICAERATTVVHGSADKYTQFRAVEQARLPCIHEDSLMWGRALVVNPCPGKGHEEWQSSATHSFVVILWRFKGFECCGPPIGAVVLGADHRKQCCCRHTRGALGCLGVTSRCVLDIHP